MAGEFGWASAGQSVLDYTLSNIQANSANAKSKRNAFLQYHLQKQLATELMDKENEYNKPINQMARLREAGLNPNLVYGNGNAIIASASGSGSVSAPNVTPSSGKMDFIARQGLLKSIEQQDANINKTEREISAIDENLDIKRQELDLAKATTMADIALKQSGQRLSNANAINQEQNNKLYEDIGKILGTEDGSRALSDMFGASAKYAPSIIKAIVKATSK